MELHRWDGIARLPEAANQPSNRLLISDHIQQCTRDLVCSHLGGLYEQEDPKFHATDFSGLRRELHYTYRTPMLQVRGLMPLPKGAVAWMHQHFRSHWLPSFHPQLSQRPV